MGEVEFVDTHNIGGGTDFFEGCRPDISIVKKGYGVSTYGTVAVIELQVGLHHALGTTCTRFGCPPVPML